MSTTEGFLTDEQIAELEADQPPLPLTSSERKALQTDAGDDTPLEPLPPATSGDEQVITGGELVHVAPGVDLPAVMPSDEFVGLAAQARVLAGSALVPQSLRGKPHDVFLVLLTGRDLGVTATSALRSCYVVDGKVTLAPALKKSLIERQGLGAIRPPAVGDVDYPNTAQRATAIVYGPDGHELGRVQLTWADVENIADKGKRLVEKSNWRNYPQRMLWWRAVGWACDDYFSGVAYGLYSPDEVGGFIDSEGQPLDVDSVEVPDGFDRAREQARIDPPLGDAAADLAARAGALPQGARHQLRAWQAERELPPRFADTPTSKRSSIDAMLASLESRARGGEWGDWSPATSSSSSSDDTSSDAGDDVVDALIVCDYCHEAPCVCAPDDDDPVVSVSDVCSECGDEPCTCPL